MRGSTLVAVLLLMSLLLVLGMALVSQSSSSAQAATWRCRAASARALALAGLNDARAKLARDLFFPLRGSQGQEVFAYSQSLTDFDGAPVGSYTVRVDSRWLRCQVIQLESVGLLGTLKHPLARRRLRMDLDRVNFTVLRVVDEGVP